MTAHPAGTLAERCAETGGLFDRYLRVFDERYPVSGGREANGEFEVVGATPEQR